MPILKPLGVEAALTTASDVSRSTVVRLVETSGNNALVTLADKDSNVLGTITLAKNGELLVRKSPSDKLSVTGGTVLATSVSYSG